MKGRKSAYDTKIKPRLEEIKAWAKNGHTDEDMMEALGISRETFYKYKRDKADFIDALKVNKEIADQTVESSLYLRANGFTYDEVTTTIKEMGGQEITETKTVKKRVLPDVTACIFWLKNRKPEQWRDKQEIDNKHSGSVTSFNVQVNSKETKDNIDDMDKM